MGRPVEGRCHGLRNLFEIFQLRVHSAVLETAERREQRHPDSRAPKLWHLLVRVLASAFIWRIASAYARIGPCMPYCTSVCTYTFVNGASHASPSPTLSPTDPVPRAY